MYVECKKICASVHINNLLLLIPTCIPHSVIVRFEYFRRHSGTSICNTMGDYSYQCEIMYWNWQSTSSSAITAYYILYINCILYTQLKQRLSYHSAYIIIKWSFIISRLYDPCHHVCFCLFLIMKVKTFPQNKNMLLI